MRTAHKSSGQTASVSEAETDAGVNRRFKPLRFPYCFARALTNVSLPKAMLRENHPTRLRRRSL
ncbi:MAG: hypothetical protein LBT53_09905, partial [Puniceicoccales bacterium]|nr:hypothetical protein [Puniceicoccales bacterium]